MQPVRIKYWGLISLTKRGYLIAGSIAAAGTAIIFVLLAVRGMLPPLRSLWAELPVRGPRFWVVFEKNFYRIVVILFVACVIDALVVLRRFAQKQAVEDAKGPDSKAAIQDSGVPQAPADVQNNHGP